MAASAAECTPAEGEEGEGEEGEGGEGEGGRGRQGKERGHQNSARQSTAQVTPHGLVEVISNRVGQCANGIIEDQQVLGLVLVEGCHQHLQDVPQVGHQLSAGLLLQRGKGAAGSLLDTLVGVQHTLQQLGQGEGHGGEG